MRWVISRALVVSFAGLCLTEVLDIADLDQYNAAQLRATASEATVSARGTPVVIVTQTLVMRQLYGSMPPSVTGVTTPAEGYGSGDLVATLETTLALKVDEAMHKSTHCKDGDNFDKQHPSRKRSSGGSLGQAICAAEAVVAQAIPGGPFNDLLLLSPNDMTFGFADAAGITAQAANVVADFVLTYAPYLDIGPEFANELAVYIFILAVDTIIQNVPLADKNRIPSSLVTTSTTTKTDCPDPTATPLLCGMDGQDCDLQMPVRPATDATCKSGQYQGCECHAPPVVFTHLVSLDEQKAMMQMSVLLEPAVEHLPDCPMNSDTIITPIPASIFSSDTDGLYSHLCDHWRPDLFSAETVDSVGMDIHMRRRLGRRTPPPDRAIWRNWEFHIRYTPTVGGGKCSTGCRSAFSKLGSACTSNAGGVYMYEKGKLDVGCGVYDFSINQPTTALAKQDQFCYDVKNFDPTGGDVRKPPLVKFAIDLCLDSKNKIIKKDDKNTFIQKYAEDRKAPYQMNIWWKDGCSLDDNGPTEMNVFRPLGSDDKWDICMGLLINDFLSCNNKGVGGNIQVGCLVYEFKADRNKRTF